MNPIITLENVTKKYGNRVVIDDVCHEFACGESIAFVGHNGCGKSTMLKILSGLARIDKGRVKYSSRPSFSYVPEKFPPMNIRMLDYLKGIARIEGVDFGVVEKLIDDFYLSDMINTNMKNMSKGSLQKVGVIQAILVPGDVLLLDEPLSGQDVASQKVFISKINCLREQGITVFMSCHEPQLVKAVSDKVYTIEQGKLRIQEEKEEAVYHVVVGRREGTVPWKEMHLYGNGYLLKITETRLNETLARLIGEGWQLRKVEEDN